MSSITSYKTTAFKESQKFLVIDPSTQSPSLVLGSDLVSYITPMLNYVRADSTRLSAENTDYDVGTLVQTSGATSPGDSFAATYLVVEGGSGDFPMLNGNDLLVLVGDDALRAQLISSASGEGSDLVAHTGTSDTVTEALDKRTVFIDSVSEMLDLTPLVDGARYDCAGFRPLTTVGGGSFVWDASEPKANHNAIDVIDPDKPFPTDFSSSAQISSWITPAGSGTGCFIRLNEEKVPNTAAGMYPDDGIEYRDNGLLDHILQTAAGNRFHLLVKSGRYDSAWDNFYSDLTVTFEKDAFFTGTIHVAINTASGSPSVNRPSNVSYYGDVGSYDRVGYYNCDNVYTERAVLKTDPMAGSPTSRGVHIYLDARDVTVDEIYVEAVADDGDYGVGVDGTTSDKPKNVRIGNIHVVDSNTHGVYLMGTNIGVDSITVDAYGAGTQTTALPLATLGESSALKGVWFNRLSEGSFVKNIKVRQGSGTRTNAADQVYCDDGEYHVGDVDVSGSSARGFAVDAQVEAPNVKATRVRSVNSAGINIDVTTGSLICDGAITSSGSLGAYGIAVAVGATLKALSISANDEAGPGLLASGTVIADDITCGAASGGDEDLIRAAGKIIANRVRCSTGTVGAVGGIYLINSTGTKIEKLELVNVGRVNTRYAAFNIDNSSNIHIGSGVMSDGLGDGFRTTNSSDCSFNGLDISGYDRNVAVSAITRFGFMNCYNHDATTTLTNMLSTQAEFFNASTMHT